MGGIERHDLLKGPLFSIAANNYAADRMGEVHCVKCGVYGLRLSVALDLAWRAHSSFFLLNISPKTSCGIVKWCKHFSFFIWLFVWGKGVYRCSN